MSLMNLSGLSLARACAVALAAGVGLLAAPEAWATAREARAQADAFFAAGNEAFAGGAYALALDAYAKARGQGLRSPDLDYNIGACYLAMERPGPAALYLRRSWLSDPRAPDAARNLNLALGRPPGSTPPGPPAPFRLLARTAWIRLACGAYALAILAVALWLAGIRGKATRALLALALAGLALSACAMSAWSDRGRGPEAILIDGPVQARLAPADSAAVAFTLREGSLLRLPERHGQWARVVSDTGSGWLRTSHLALVDEAAAR